ncbi:hypothetical protein AHAS_Ahas02G0178300 [Arachis hypogaea]
MKSLDISAVFSNSDYNGAITLWRGGHTSLPLVPPLVPLLVAAAAGGTDHHSHSLLPLLTTNPSLFTMSTSRQVLDSNAPTPGSAGPTVGTVSVDPAAPVRSNRVDPG